MTVSSQSEIERKYEVDDDAVLPRFDGLEQAGLVSVRPMDDLDLAAEYFDTVGGDLAVNRITLRRRTGGADEGWHLKLPADEGRTELHWPLDTDSTDHAQPVPAVVLGPVRAIVRDRRLVMIARIGTRRSVVHLLGPDAAGLVEIADDSVTASDVSTGIVRIWREWEAELLPDAHGRTGLLDAVEESLRSAGARPAASVSKLASALGRTELGERTTAPDVDAHSTASEVVLVAVRSLIGEMIALDPLVRRDEPDSVHRLRTRVRRLRSVFATYRGVLDVPQALRDRLREFGSVLGMARDAEVMRDRSGALVDAHEEIPRGVRGVLVRQWDEDHARARNAVVDELSSERYYRLLDALDDFAARPALAADAFAPAPDVLRTAIKKDLRRVRSRAETADAAGSDVERIPLLHETRKAAKRLRYAADAVSEGDGAVLGARARQVADAAEAVHDLLGEHRDSVLMQKHLRATATASGHPFEYGVLHELERHSAALCLTDYRSALARLRSRGKKL